MNKAIILGSVVVLCCSAGVSYAKPFVYPQKGQSAQQQQADHQAPGIARPCVTVLVVTHCYWGKPLCYYLR